MGVDFSPKRTNLFWGYMINYRNDRREEIFRLLLRLLGEVGPTNRARKEKGRGENNGCEIEI